MDNKSNWTWGSGFSQRLMTNNTDLQIEQANRLSGRYIRDSLAYVCAHINRRSNLQVIRIRLKFGRHCKSLWKPVGQNWTTRQDEVNWPILEQRNDLQNIGMNSHIFIAVSGCLFCSFHLEWLLPLTLSWRYIIYVFQSKYPINSNLCHLPKKCNFEPNAVCWRAWPPIQFCSRGSPSSPDLQWELQQHAGA